MAGFFLMTSALQIQLLWPESPLTKYLKGIPTGEVWISPLSHAILIDSFMSDNSVPTAIRKRGIAATRRHQQQIISFRAPYPYPDREAVRIWSECRSLEIDIPAYNDGTAALSSQSLGPDELLVFATAAALGMPLIGPSPTDPLLIDELKYIGINFSPLALRR